MFYFFLFLTIITISLCFLLYGGYHFYTLFLFIRWLSLSHSLPIRTGAVSLIYIYTLSLLCILSSYSYGGYLSYIYILSLIYSLPIRTGAAYLSLSLSLTLFLFVRGLPLLYIYTLSYILSFYSYGGCLPLSLSYSLPIRTGAVSFILCFYLYGGYLSLIYTLFLSVRGLPLLLFIWAIYSVPIVYFLFLSSCLYGLLTLLLLLLYSNIHSKRTP
jgi:hypothetical protein